jgi:hypothetical protein
MKKYIINLIIILSLSTYNLIAQESKKDTLFFKFDKKYFIEGKIEKKHYYIKEESKQGSFYFEEISIDERHKPKSILCFKKYLHNSKFYNKEKKISYDDELSIFLKKYIIFLVKEVDRKTNYIQVRPTFEID